MALSPMYMGQLHPAWTFEWRTDSGKLKDFTGLSASNFQLLLKPVAGGSDIVGGGTFVIVSNPGWLQYQPVAADMAAAGTYSGFIVATFPGTLPDVSDPFTLQIIAK